MSLFEMLYIFSLWVVVTGIVVFVCIATKEFFDSKNYPSVSGNSLQPAISTATPPLHSPTRKKTRLELEVMSSSNPIHETAATQSENSAILRAREILSRKS